MKPVTGTNVWHNTLCMVVGKSDHLRQFLRQNLSVFLVVVALGLHGLAQDALPAVGFGFSFPGSQPEHYAISIPASGNATYYSDGKLTADSDSDAFRVEFSISEATRTRLFDLAKRANYFDGELDSRKKGLASTGAKTLTYKDGQRVRQATYNYSQIPAVQELTRIFQNLSTTMEFGRRLDYYHRYQKLALDDELKRMEDMAKQNSLEELGAVAPMLEQIANDQTVINPVRARAQRLLAQASASR
jgi:hypothetical protein